MLKFDELKTDEKSRFLLNLLFAKIFEVANFHNIQLFIGSPKAPLQIFKWRFKYFNLRRFMQKSPFLYQQQTFLYLWVVYLVCILLPTSTLLPPHHCYHEASLSSLFIMTSSSMCYVIISNEIISFVRLMTFMWSLIVGIPIIFNEN